MLNAINHKLSQKYINEEARIQEAIWKVAEEPKPNIATLACQFGVPEQRLREQRKGRQSRQRESPNRKLAHNEELARCQYFNQLDEIGIPSRYNNIASYANTILESITSSLSGPIPTRSQMWTTCFLALYPEYHIRKQKTLEVDRETSHDLELLQELFNWFKKIKEEKGFLDSDTYKFDETEFKIGIG